MVMEFLITNKCNLHCSHCIRGDLSNDSMSYKDFLDGVNKSIKYFDNLKIVLSGGEPTLNADFKKMLDYLLNCHESIKIAVASNGTTNFFKKDISWLSKYNDRLEFQISLDGSEYYNDKVRGKGTFQKAFLTIQKLNACGINFSISTVVMASNIASMEEFKSILKKSNLNLFEWRVYPVLLFGRAQFSDEYVKPYVWNEFVKKLFLEDIANIRIKSSPLLFDFDHLEYCKAFENNTIFKNKINICGSGKNHVYVYPDMSVYACYCTKKYSYGNLKATDKLDEIFLSENANVMCNYKLKHDSPCLMCKYVGVCNGGCKGMSINNFGVPGVGDLRCPNFRLLSKGTPYEFAKLKI